MVRARRLDLVLLVVIVLVGACGGRSPTTGPAGSSPPASAVPAATPSGPPAAGTLAPEPAALLPGALAVTVSDRLRVRSEPRVADDSIKYEPVLPLGTELTVVGGPVQASGYAWYQVEPLTFVLDGGVSRGWVAIADHDGTAWVAPADDQIAGLEVALSTLARAIADPTDAGGAASSLNAFGIDLYRQMLRDPKLDLGDRNAVFSPTSIALALGMVRAGARGATATQMDDVLHTPGWDELGPGLNALDQALRSRSATWTDDEGTRSLALRIANTSFAQRDWSIERPFLDAIAAAFGAGVDLVDYRADPEAARQTINAWVKRQTVGRIPELLAPPDVTTLTRLYLVNAIYLKAEWDQWFWDGETKDRDFTRLDGSTVKVPTMTGSRGGLGPIAPYVRGKDWQGIELGYRGPDGSRPLAMALILPDDLRAFEGKLTPKRLAQVLGALDDERAAWDTVACPSSFDAGCYPYDLRIFMPRFGIETRAGLADQLAAIGMPIAFDQARADFTGIHVPTDPMENIYISAVIHQANIDVDEKGTEAAAATAVGMDTGGGPSPLKNVTFLLDHPFLFVLRDVGTGAVLFMGRVVDPSVER
jgi:serpin B